MHLTWVSLRGAIPRRREWDSVGCWGGDGEKDYSGQKDVGEELGNTFCDRGWPRAERWLGGDSLYVCLAEPTGGSWHAPSVILSLQFSGAPGQSSLGLMSGLMSDLASAVFPWFCLFQA